MNDTRITELESEINSIQNDISLLYDKQFGFREEHKRLLIEKYITPNNLQKSAWVCSADSNYLEAVDRDKMGEVRNVFGWEHDRINLTESVSIIQNDWEILLYGDTLSDLVDFAKKMGLKISSSEVDSEISKLETELIGLYDLKKMLEES